MERAIVLPFSIDESGSIYSSSDPKQIWQSRVIAAVMTHIGERVFRPRYGGTIKSSVFENSNIASEIVKNSVTTVFASFLKELTLGQVETVMDSQYSLLNVTIYYTLPNGEQDNVTVKTGIVTRSGEITQEY